MRNRLTIAGGFTLALIALLGLGGCSKDSSPKPDSNGALELVVHYQGSLGTVDAQHTILARLYEGVDTFADGPPDFSHAATQNPELLRFTDLPAGTYTLSVVFDAGGDGLQQTCPYEVYNDKAFGATPDPVVIQGGRTTELTLAFGDTHTRAPWQAMPTFALPDSNPGSAGYGTTLTPADLAGARAIVYFAEARNEPLPDFTLTDVNPHSPDNGQPVAFSSMRNRRVMLFFGEST
jgi:uncharacterized protein (DUF2141 family)